MTVVAACMSGLVLGLRHALEPDHLAAVGNFVRPGKSARQGAAIGALWGAGHASTLLLFGALVISLQVSAPGWLDSALEALVGVVLVVLGVRSAAGALRGGAGHSHSHSRGQDATSWRPMAMGAMHGAAGTGAAVLLATTALEGAEARVAFLAVFGAGAALSMALVAGLASLPLARTLGRGALGKWCVVALGVASTGIGVWWFAQAAPEALAALG